MGACSSRRQALNSCETSVLAAAPFFETWSRHVVFTLVCTTYQARPETIPPATSFFGTSRSRHCRPPAISRTAGGPAASTAAQKLPTSWWRAQDKLVTTANAEAGGRSRYSGSPAARSASPRHSASAGSQCTPANWRLKRNVGCSSRTRAAAAPASSNRPSFARAAAN